MSEFDQLFEKHRDSFDRLEPKQESWEAIKNAMGKESNAKEISFHSRRNALMRIAAAVILVMGVAAVFLINYNSKNYSFHDLAMTSPEGESIALDPAANKFTLVQFWASGNALCTEENCYYYLPAYEKYKDQGFEIYAISLDEDRNSWISHIEENQLPWIHVSDLKGWDSPVCIECNITKVPSNFLLNQKGKIIARDLDAQHLDETLNRLMAEN